MIRSKIKSITWVLFILYSALMFWELFLGNYRTLMVSRSINLIPFKTVWQYVSNHGHYSVEILFINLVANIIVFIPFGFLVPIIKYNFRNLLKILILGFCTVLLAESVQYLFKLGIFDIDDLILNTLGVGIGYGIFKIFTKKIEKYC